ncbi:MAG: hypothetical protein JNK05_21975 [Myxococcales bacterium]|nr:hypothetical protein [Myxococcales bacterium]
MAARRALPALVASALLVASRAHAQDAGVADASATSRTTTSATAQTDTAIRWPLRLPGLDATINDPRDGRAWGVTTRINATSVTVIAAVQNGQLALVFEQRRTGPTSCAATLVAEARTQQAVYTLRAESALALRGPGFDPEAAFQLRAGGFDLEYGCVEANGRPWLVTAMSNARTGYTLADATAMNGRVAEALRGRGARGDGTVRLETTGLDLGALDIEGPWLFTGDAVGFPLAGDVVSSRAGDRGGVTLTVAMRAGRCIEAWDALRAWLTSEGQRLDRPAYVPNGYGPRIRRVPSGERVREVYCAQPTPERALIVSAVFAQNDADATARTSAMLERLLRAATPARLASPTQSQRRAPAASSN